MGWLRHSKLKRSPSPNNRREDAALAQGMVPLLLQEENDNLLLNKGEDPPLLLIGEKAILIVKT